MVDARIRETLALLDLYGLLTIDTIHRLQSPHVQQNAVIKYTSRLRERKLIRAHILNGRKIYFTRDTLPLGPKAILENYAVLLYCSRTKQPRLSAVELAEEYPFMPTNRQFYCRTESGIRQLRVSILGKEDVTVRKLINHHKTLLYKEEYRRLIDQHRFSLRLIVPSEGRARRINRHLANHKLPFEVKPIVFPRLLDLAGGATHA